MLELGPQRTASVLIAIVVAVLCATSAANAEPTPMACVPGGQVNCPCLSGIEGTQVCKDDGSGFHAGWPSTRLSKAWNSIVNVARPLVSERRSVE